MRYGAFDVLRRGFDSSIANWPLIGIRFAEVLFYGVLAVITAVAMIVPIIVSIGFALNDLDEPENLAALVMALAGRWMVLFWVAVAVITLLVLFLAIHSFVEAGRARVLVAAERAAGPAMDGPRSRFAAFDARSWYAGAAAGWWPVFWIYNAAWALAGLILLIPLLPTLVLMLALSSKPGAMVAAGCFGLFFTALLAVVVFLLTGMWTTRSIVEWARGHASARAALSAGRRAVRDDFGRHLLVTVAAIVVGMAGGVFFASFSFLSAFGAALGNDPGLFDLVTLPIRVVGSVLSSVFSAWVATWMLGGYAALVVEEETAEEHAPAPDVLHG